MNPAHHIETERLSLRVCGPADASCLWRILDESRDQLAPWIAPPTAPSTSDDAARLLRSFRVRFDLDQGYLYGIFRRQDGELIGCADLLPGRWALGYWVHRDFAGVGYATEAAAALTKLALCVLGAERLEIHCDAAHGDGWRVANYLGFRRQTTVHEAAGRAWTIWALRADELDTSHAGTARIFASDRLWRTVTDDWAEAAPSSPPAWPQLLRHLRATQTIVAEKETSLTVAVHLALDNDQPMTEVVSAQLAWMLDEPQVVLRAFVDSADSFALGDALVHSGLMGAGALCLEDHDFFLHHAMSLDNPAEVGRAVRLLAHKAACLRQRRQPESSRQLRLLTSLAD
jgi:RimJ/RimL family protein N-acetyltransferase